MLPRVSELYLIAALKDAEDFLWPYKNFRMQLHFIPLKSVDITEIEESTADLLPKHRVDVMTNRSAWDRAGDACVIALPVFFPSALEYPVSLYS